MCIVYTCMYNNELQESNFNERSKDGLPNRQMCLFIWTEIYNDIILSLPLSPC